MTDILYCGECKKFMISSCSHSPKSLAPPRYSPDRWSDSRRKAKKESKDYKDFFS